MAQYATADDVKAFAGVLRLDELTADQGTSADDNVIIQECIEQSSLIDSYLCGRYSTPIAGPASILSVLKTHCVRLALYGLFQGRLMAEAFQTIQEDRDITLEWLRGVASGKYSLPGQTPPNASPTEAQVDMAGGSQDQIFGNNQWL